MPTSPTIHHLTSFYPYKEFCEKNHKDLDPTSCAVAYTWYKQQPRKFQMNALNAPFRILSDYIDKEDALKPLLIMRNWNRQWIHVGLLFYMLGIKFNKGMV
jgi:hypothetical protein